MLTLHRTYRATIRNHGQVEESLDRHGWNAGKLWNVANGDVNGAENIRRDINDESNSESPASSGGDRSTGWLAQPAVYLHDLSHGFQPREHVVDCKP